MKSYYNTNKMFGEKLEQAINNNVSQEHIIELIYKKQQKPLSPYQCYLLYPTSNVPLTSIRRAITNLTSQNVLFKTNKTVMGGYGKPEHLYQLNSTATNE